MSRSRGSALRRHKRAKVERLREQDAARRAALMLGERCTCGSGGHPRYCKKHPGAYDAHIAELSFHAS